MGFFEGDNLQKTNWTRKATAVALWISLNLADLVVTMVAIGGGFIEGNPIAAWIGGNSAGLVGYKITLTLLSIVFLFYLRKAHLLKWLNILMAAVVVWNLAVLFIS